MLGLAIDHARGLCQKPDIPQNTPLVIAKDIILHCLCCGGEMEVISDAFSVSLQELGMYEVICHTCPLISHTAAI